MWSDISDSVRGYWKHRKAMSRSHWIGMVMLAVNQATAGCRPIPARWSERIVRDNGAAKVLDLCDPPPPKESVSDQPTFFVRQRVLCLQIAEECGVSITDLLIIESTQPNLC